MMRSTLSLGIGMAVLVSLATPTPAPAQDMINNLPDYTSAWVMGDLMQRRGRDFDGRSTSKTSKAPSRPRSKAADLERLATYTPSAAVESRVDDAFASYLAGRSPASPPMLLRALAVDSPPGSPFARLLAVKLGSGGDAIRTQLQRGQLQSDYARWLTTMGYSDRNLFDVNTAFLMHSWSIANNGVTTRYPKITFGAVRDDLAARQDSARLAGRGNAQKQEEAQSFALFTALLVSAWQDADPRQRAVLRNGVAALGRRIGVDYTQVKLSAGGFQSR
jgi:hypothetical protein